MNIYRLDNIPAHELGAVGGKAKGLYNLSQAGLNVAPGFVITNLADDEDLDCAAEYFVASGLECVAVRSSANAEDGADFSNAGQYKTVLNVSSAEEFRDAVMTCLMSLESREAESYSAYFNQARSTSMSVVVQYMVDARKAGVCFTADPTGTADTLLVEAVEGLGEDLVSGAKSAVQYRVSKDGLRSDGTNGLLSESELKRICSEALVADEKLDMPLDTEWAIDAGGTLYWLQARPITTSDEADIYELDPCHDWGSEIITNCNIGEMLPNAVTPLTLSTSVLAIDCGMRRMLAAAGVYRTPEDIAPFRCVVSVGNHLFINLSVVEQLGDYVLGADKDSVELSICGRILTDKPAGSTLPARRISGFKKAVNGLKYVRFLMSRNKVRRNLEKLSREFSFKRQPDLHAQYAEIDRTVHLINDALSMHYVTSAHSGAMSSALFMVLNEEIKDPEQTRFIIAGLLENIDNIESVDILRSLRSVAKALAAVRKDAPAMSDEQMLEFLRADTGDAGRYYREFMSKHGHRAVREAEMSARGWAQDDAGFTAYLRTVLASESNPRPEQAKGETVDNLAELDKRLGGKNMKAIRYLTKQSRLGVVNRESSKSSSIRVVNEFKIAYADLAEMMAAEGLLPDADLIYFMQHDEIGRLIGTKDGSLIKRALQRRRLYAEQRMLRFREVYYGKPVPEEEFVPDGDSDDVLKGTPVSRGIARGRVRIVRTLEDANKLEKGEIMVASFTDIGWSPYYCVIGALITEIGSALSHGAVVAREYSLPLITNIKHATSLLKDGDMISVNANTGTIIVEERG